MPSWTVVQEFTEAYTTDQIHEFVAEPKQPKPRYQSAYEPFPQASLKAPVSAAPDPNAHLRTWPADIDTK